MASDTLSRLQNAFEHAISLPADLQQQYLLQLSESDPNLHRELITLLANDKHTNNFIHSALNATFDDMQKDKPLWIGKTFGAFKITAEIASGGMGVVFLGVRDDGQFEQQVAIKVLSGILASTQILQAFDSEREIFARMHHPYIAQLYDGGATADGVPYLIMEYVDGIPIDQYCENNQLSIKQRLKLFIKVAEAVSYAHRNLIVHRDIKPSNILVTRSGIPKLLDFGIAKSIDAKTGTQQGEITQLGNRPFTPAFASPEQIKGQVITTSSDIFSLGVLLHHLLSGGLPFEKVTDANLASNFSAPTSPSLTFKKRYKALKIQGNLDVKHFRALTGDLDAIVLKSLNEESERRYVSVDSMADDIGRFLDNKPVLAQKNSRIYRTQKYLHRHWFGVSAGAFLALLSLSFTSYILLQTMALKKEQEVSREVIKFLKDMITLKDIESISDKYSYYSNFANVSFIELLSLGEKRLDGILLAEPQAKSSLIRSFAASYKIAGDLEAAKRIMQKALQLHEDFNSISTMEKIALLNDYGQILLYKNELNEAKTTLLHAFELLNQVNSDDKQLRYRIIDNLAKLSADLGDYEAGLQYDLKKLKLTNSLYGEESINTAWAVYNISLGLWQLGRFNEALEMANNALSRFRKQTPIPHASIADSYNFIGTLLKETQPHLGQALKHYYQSLNINKTHLGKEHLHLVVDLYEIARIELDKGDWRKAQTQLQKAEKIQLEKVGEDSLDMIRVVNDQAEIAILTADNVQADILLNRAEAICKRLFDLDHPIYADILANRARLQSTYGNRTIALVLLEQRYQLSRNKYSQNHPKIRYALFDWISELLVNNQVATARKHFAVEISRNIQPTVITEIALQRLILQAKFADLDEDYVRANALHQRIHEATTSLYGKHSHIYAQTLNNWATFLSQRNNQEKAEQIHTEHCLILKTLFDREHPSRKACDVI
jgi:serine/threonine-protein kinase